MSDDSTPSPVELQVKAAPVLANEGLRVIILGTLAVVADRFIHHDLLIPAVLAGLGYVATWAVGAIQHLRTIGLHKTLVEIAPHLVRAKR